jgi:hypothetical protein
MKPIETGKIGETISAPSVADYLAEICKEDNVDVDQYLKNHTVKTLDKSLTSRPKTFRSIHIQQDHLLNPKMTYNIWDRLGSVWLVLKDIKHSPYRIFDFNKYPHDDYYNDSTPWDRFKSFVKFQWTQIKWAWNYTPEHIKHFNNNKPRIGWFENKLKDLFFLNWDDNKDQTIKELKEKGYQVENNRIWHEPIPLDKDKKII